MDGVAGFRGSDGLGTGPAVTFLSSSADFGFARYLQNNMMAATLCGSPMYMVRVSDPDPPGPGSAAHSSSVPSGARSHHVPELRCQSGSVEHRNHRFPVSDGEGAVPGRLLVWTKLDWF